MLKSSFRVVTPGTNNPSAFTRSRRHPSARLSVPRSVGGSRPYKPESVAGFGPDEPIFTGSEVVASENDVFVCDPA